MCVCLHASADVCVGGQTAAPLESLTALRRQRAESSSCQSILMHVNRTLEVPPTPAGIDSPTETYKTTLPESNLLHIMPQKCANTSVRASKQTPTMTAHSESQSRTVIK